MGNIFSRGVLSEIRSHLGGIRRLPATLTGRAYARNIKFNPSSQNVCYLTRRFPEGPYSRTEMPLGGEVKLTYLEERFPHSSNEARFIYLVSGAIPNDAKFLVQKLKERGLKLIVNQDGLYYRAWYGDGWEKRNEFLKWIHDSADFVIYQSEFCAKSVEHFFGARAPKSAVIYNPVDLSAFANSAQRGEQPRLITLAGGKDRSYRLKLAIEVLSATRKMLPDATLAIAGFGDSAVARQMKAEIHQWCRTVGISESAVTFLPPFTRQMAPAVLGGANIFLHTALNDPCPNIICEALASGLPPVFISSGGVPELVGSDAGEGVPSQLSWEKFALPDAGLLANCVFKVWQNWERYNEAARKEATQRLALERFYEEHQRIFSNLS